MLWDPAIHVVASRPLSPRPTAATNRVPGGRMHVQLRYNRLAHFQQVKGKSDQNVVAARRRDRPTALVEAAERGYLLP